MSLKDTIMNAFDIVTATIASGSTASGACALGGLRLFGITFPAAMTGTTVALQASFDGGTTWSPVVDKSGTAQTITLTAGSYTFLDPVITAAIPMLRLVSNASEAASRSITLVLRAI